jgi:hypothetical protein
MMLSRTTRLKERLARLENSRDNAQATFDSLLADSKKSARLDTGNGLVSFSNHNLGDLERIINTLDAEIDKVIRQLHGGTVVVSGLRRHL